MEAEADMGDTRRSAAVRGLPSVGAWATMLTLWLPPGELAAEVARPQAEFLAEAAAENLTGGGPGVFLPPPSQERAPPCPPPPGSAPPAVPPTNCGS